MIYSLHQAYQRFSSGILFSEAHFKLYIWGIKPLKPKDHLLLSIDSMLDSA